MAAQLTPWEEDQVTCIDLLLRNAEIKQAEFNRVHTLLNEPQGLDGMEDNVRLRFRSFLSDLYSVLDYTCYLLYSHYRNGGQPSYSAESRNVKFPYTTKLKQFRGDPNEDPERALKRKRDDWITKQCQLIFGGGNDQFRNLMEDIQPKMSVNRAGDPIPANESPEVEGDARSFSLLHFFRNYSTHRNLINLYSEVGVLHINLDTNERTFLPAGADNQPQANGNIPPGNIQRIEIAKGFWVEVPDLRRYNRGQLQVNDPTQPTPLLEVVPQLLSFVKSTRDRLLIPLTHRYNHNVQRAWEDGLNIDGMIYEWEQYDPILKRIVH